VRVGLEKAELYTIRSDSRCLPAIIAALLTGALMSSENKGVQIFEVSGETDGQRVDNFLSSRLKGVPRSHVYRLIRKGEIRVNKKRIKPDTRLHTGDMVRVAPLRMTETEAPLAPSAALSELLRRSILFETDAVMVLNKPQGLAVHTGSGLKTGLIEALRQIYPEHPHLELVHRIDKETSGCILVSKNSHTLKHLQSQIKEKSLRKTYLALVHGAWPERLDRIDAPLHKESVERGSGIVTVDPEGKSALTQFAIVERFIGATLIQAMPITGRTHQIRVHCQFAGHPIVGDSKYTSQARNALASVKNLCLHAAILEFTLPGSRKHYRVEAPMGNNMVAVLSRLQPL
jgi:23S rRNA pseudouridine955/2504/2580 synthase